MFIHGSVSELLWNYFNNLYIHNYLLQPEFQLPVDLVSYDFRRLPTSTK